ncbi:MAG TPA: peptide deformylase [Firmicutes bacterium]|nr:peptide deformylase [Bacillota bacterium]
MLKIVKDKKPSLRMPSKDVEMPLSEEDKNLLEEMLDYLKKSQDPAYREKHPYVREGIGLAAPQIGVNKKMLVIHYLDDPEKETYITYGLVNPKIISNSIRKCYLKSGEGCLSVDEEHKGYAYRDYKITVKGYDAFRGEDISIRAIGFDAIVLQHEIDHLHGILFYDHIDKKNPFKEIPGSVAI